MPAEQPGGLSGPGSPGAGKAGREGGRQGAALRFTSVTFAARTRLQEEDELFNITNRPQPPFATVERIVSNS